MSFMINFADRPEASICLDVPECFRHMRYPTADKVYRALFDNIGWCRFEHRDGTVSEGQEAADELEAMIVAVTQQEAWREYYPALLLAEQNETVRRAIRTLESNQNAWFRQKSKWKARLEKRFGKTGS